MSRRTVRLATVGLLAAAPACGGQPAIEDGSPEDEAASKAELKASGLFCAPSCGACNAVCSIFGGRGGICSDSTCDDGGGYDCSCLNGG